jgi:hypothetical protein
MDVSLNDLQGYVGKSIGQICNNGFALTSQFHCAHVVSHILDIRMATLCGDLTYDTRRTGATIRCDELYNGLVRKGLWDQKPTPDNGLLIFCTAARNVNAGGHMMNVRQKHVGIYYSGMVFNYSNARQKVVADRSVEAFFNKLNAIYDGDDISLFYGVAQ